MLRKNNQGGLLIYNKEDLERAKAADLVTLPEDVKGTNCYNCMYIFDKKDDIGFCKHPKVAQYVNERMCCALWDNRKIYRQFGEIDKKYED